MRRSPDEAVSGSPADRPIIITNITVETGLQSFIPERFEGICAFGAVVVFC